MAIQIPRGKMDDIVRQIADVLKDYEMQHPRAQIDLYRQNPASVRIRIIDPDFAGADESERQDAVWAVLDHLPEETQSDISMLVLLAPAETSRSMANLEFDDPVPSRL